MDSEIEQVIKQKLFWEYSFWRKFLGCLYGFSILGGILFLAWGAEAGIYKINCYALKNWEMGIKPVFEGRERTYKELQSLHRTIRENDLSPSEARRTCRK